MIKLPILLAFLLSLVFVIGAIGCSGETETPTLSPNPSPTLAFSYSEQEIDYFLEIAFGSELGADIEVISKWSGEVRIVTKGTPTEEDLITLNAVVEDINELTQGSIQIQITDNRPNVTVWFVPFEDMADYALEYFYPQPAVANTLARVGSYECYECVMTVTSDRLTQSERSHLIREELTQALGLFQDSWLYPESIFYQGWTTTHEFAEIDHKVIEILYREEIHAGMTKDEVRRILIRNPSSTAVPTSTPIAIPTTGYTIYTDAENRFTFAYPDNWEIVLSPQTLLEIRAPNPCAIIVPTFYITADELTSSKNMNVFLDNYQPRAWLDDDFTLDSLVKMTASGQEAIRAVYTQAIDGGLYGKTMKIHLIKGLTAWHLGFASSPDCWDKYEAVFDIIVSSFQIMN